MKNCGYQKPFYAAIWAACRKDFSFMLFGLACEGPTDQITIENILCGYFENSDLGEHIDRLQPPFDETDQKHGDAGCHTLFKYLASTRFRDDVLNTNYVILQIDSDIAKKIQVPDCDSYGNELATEALITNIQTKLIASINNGANGFYETHAEKIIFAICVHSLECWLVAHHGEQNTIHDCFEVLKTVIDPKRIRVAKKRRNYDQLSQPFLDRQNLIATASKDTSLNLFLQALEPIEVNLDWYSISNT